MKKHLLIHYGEIGLKLGNKDYFVSKLTDAVKDRLKTEFGRNFVVKHSLSRLLISLDDDFDEERGIEVLKKIFGIKNFSFVFEGTPKIGKLGEEIWDKFPNFSESDSGAPQSFKVKVKRSMKVPFTSVEMERGIGAFLLGKGLNMKVKLKDPDFTVHIELFNEKAFFSFKKYEGAGGLSPGTQGKLIATLSAGIDSPVAAYKMMRRGARVIFVHFHGYPYTDKDEMEQVQELTEILGEYQTNTKLYLVPFGFIQKNISTNTEIPARVRTILYRRMMLRIAEKICFKERAKGLITGDNFGQVASQTPENIFAIHDVTTVPLFQPLIGFDKEEIIDVAKKIGTFEVSKLPCKESCTMFMPKSPELRAKIEELRECEKNLPIEEWVLEAIREMKVD